MGANSAYPKTVQSGKPCLHELPGGWFRAPLGDFIKEVRRPAKLEDTREYDLVTVKRARGGVNRREHLLGKDILVKSQFFIEEGDFLISKRQIVHGACGLVPKELSGSIVSNEYAALSGKGNFDMLFLKYLSESVYFQQTCFHSSIGVHIEKMLFKLDRWLRFEFNLPPLYEQTKIAQILSTWDKAIETTEKLIENSKTQKKALMQQLMTGKSRFPGFNGEWRSYKFEKIASLSKLRFDPKTATKHGFCVELEHIEQNVGALKGGTETLSDTSTKAVFQPSDVLFGKLRPYLRKYWLADKSGVCSTEIWVFQAKKNICYSSFLFFLVQTSRFIRAASVSSGSKMPRADWKYVKNFSFAIPGLVEQEKLVNAFQLLDRDIENRSKVLRLLQKERLALMQQLFTGKRRVKVESEGRVHA